MSDQDYERRVAALVTKHAKLIAYEAGYGLRAAADIGLSGEAAHEQAREHVSYTLLGDAEWEHVEAVDISDIAYEFTTDAQREAEGS